MKLQPSSHWPLLDSGGCKRLPGGGTEPHHVGPKLGKAVSPSQTSALSAEEEGAAFPKSPEGGKQQCVKGAGSQGRQHLLRCPSLVVTGHRGVGEQQMSLDVCSAGLKGQPGYLEKE